METALMESLSKLSTPHLLIVLVGYSIGRLTAYAIQSHKSSHKPRLMILQADVQRLKNELAEERQSRSVPQRD